MLVSARKEGARGDGRRDDTAALQAAAAKAAQEGRTFYLPPGGYKVSDTIGVPRGVDVLMRGSLRYGGPPDRPALRIGDQQPNVARQLVGLRVRHEGPITWPEGYRGIELINLYASNVWVENAQGFTTGVRLCAIGHDCCGNTFVMGRFVNNRIHCDMDARNGGGVVGNRFFHGRFTNFGHGPAGVELIGYRLHSSDGSHPRNGGNLWLNAAMELRAAQAEPAAAVCYDIRGGSHNEAWFSREENGSVHAPNIRHMRVDGLNRTGLGRGNLCWIGYWPSRPPYEQLLQERGGAAGNGIAAVRLYARHQEELGGHSTT